MLSHKKKYKIHNVTIFFSFIYVDIKQKINMKFQKFEEFNHLKSPKLLSSTWCEIYTHTPHTQIIPVG